MNSIDLLYIHPHGQLVDDHILPSGAITCMNAYTGSKAGILSCELNEQLVRAARVIAIDLFWASSYWAVQSLVAHIRGIKPGIPIILGGFTASQIPVSIKKYLDIDYVLSHPYAEETFKKIAAFHTSDNCENRDRTLPEWEHLHTGKKYQTNSIDPLTTSWFQSKDPLSQLTIHLTRTCENRFPGCRHCVASRESANEYSGLLYDHDTIAKFIRTCPRDTEFFLSGLPVETISLVLKIFLTNRVPTKLHIFTCGLLPEDIIDFIDSTADSNIYLYHMTPWHPHDWESLAGRDKQLGILAALAKRSVQNDTNRLRLHKTITGSPETEEIIRPFIKDLSLFKYPLNWKLLDSMDDTEDSVKQVQEFSAMVNKTLVLKHLAPFYFRHFKFGSDPQFELPRELPESGTEAFYRSVIRGYAKWKTILPETITYTAIPVQRSSSGSLTLLGNHGEIQCDIKITYQGWEITVPVYSFNWESIREALHAGPGTAGFVILPRGLEPVLSTSCHEKIRVFPFLPGYTQAISRITITGDRIYSKFIVDNK
ncbi:MAG: hypothetical protein GY754_19570 [bacterium]|nr:hypothetical protein [bacterium]